MSNKAVVVPRMDILPQAQRALWPQLAPATRLGFVLYGGTAIALRLGHRTSVDFDFFTDRPLDCDAIKTEFPFASGARVLQERSDTLSLLVSNPEQNVPVHVSFFGGLAFGRVGNPAFTEDGILQLASLDDLMATKVKVILQRAEAKDYRDIAAMIAAGVNLAKGLASAQRMFGPNFQPSESLKALVYFKDGDLHTLTETEKTLLIQAVSSVHDLPTVDLLSRLA